MAFVLVVLGCIAVNAALAALEAAFISASRADIDVQTRAGDARARRFLRLRETPERTLSAIQVGITLVSIVSGAAGGVGAQELLSPVLEARFDLTPGVARAIGIVVVAVPVLLATVVVGELVPKTLALRHPAHVALAGARWLHLLERAFLPLVELLAWMTRVVLAVIPRGAMAATPQTVPEADDAGQRQYTLDLQSLAHRRVRDAMVPWSQAVVADVAQSSQSAAELALSSRHTRVPVIEEGRVVGLLHTKELLSFVDAGEQDWRTLVRSAVTVGQDDRLLSVLRLLQRRRSHLAVVTAPDGALLGIVTLEDILEEVLGDLYDEDDDRAVERILGARGKVRGHIMQGRR